MSAPDPVRPTCLSRVVLYRSILLHHYDYSLQLQYIVHSDVMHIVRILRIQSVNKKHCVGTDILALFNCILVVNFCYYSYVM